MLDFGIVSDYPRQNFGAVLEQFETEILRLFLDSPELDYETHFRTIHVYSFRCIAKSE